MIEVTPGPLPIHFFTIVVKASAVDRSFPGGRKAFIGAHDPKSHNGSLFCLSSMGPESVDWHLTRLEAAGIVLGMDAALADMTDGPQVDCPGLLFKCEGDWFGARWSVAACAGSGQQHAQAREAVVAPIQRVPADTQVSRPLGDQSSAVESGTAWKRVMGPMGRCFWTGGEDDED
jgi:hypothetical protein